MVHTLVASSNEIGQLLFSPDKRLLAACDDKIITLWNTDTASLQSTIDDQDDMFFDMAFSPDNKMIAAASNDGNACIWSTVTGELLQMVTVDDERMLSLAFSPDSTSIATGSEVMRVWNVDTGELQHTLLGPGDHSLSFSSVYEGHEFPSEIENVFFSPDGNMLVSTCPGTQAVRLWSTETWELKQTIKGYEASFSPDGVHFAVKVDDTIEIYGTTNWQLQSISKNQDKRLALATFSPDSKVIVTCSGREIMLWDIETGEAIKTFEDPARNVSAISISPDGKMLISGTRKCGLRVWELDAGRALGVLDHEDGVRDPWGGGVRCDPPAIDVLFSDGRGKVALAFRDGSIRIWDVDWSGCA